MKIRWIFKGLGILALVAVGITLFTYVTMSLWNWLVPELFHGPTITAIQALGLLLLSKILFGGFHGRRGWRGHGGHWHGGNPYWKAKLQAKWEAMTPEEREKKRQAYEKYCGRWGWKDCGPDMPTEKANTNEPQG